MCGHHRASPLLYIPRQTSGNRFNHVYGICIQYNPQGGVLDPDVLANWINPPDSDDPNAWKKVFIGDTYLPRT